MKRWYNLILLASALALSLILGEVFVRVFLGDHLALFPRYHDEVNYGEFSIRRLKPQTTFWHTSVDGSWQFTVNSQGFRGGHDFAYARDGVGLRVIVLGDSHTQGFETRQDHTYAAVIEKYLNSRGLKAEVINAGVAGFSTAEEAVFLEFEGFKYDPDVVILGFFANDLEDNIKADLFRLQDDALTVHKTRHVPGAAVLKLHNAIAPLRWLSENSYLYSLAMNTAWDSAKLALLSRKQKEMSTELAVATGHIGAYEKRLTARLIERMYRLCKERGTVFIVLDVPQYVGPGEFSTSLPSDLLEEFQANSDALIRSEPILSPYRHLAEFHVPHGQRHISELSHMLLGVAAAQTIQGLAPSGRIAQRPTTGPSTKRAVAAKID
jgi:hypothetical protein